MISRQKLKTYLKIAWAPLVLGLLFVAQNHLYNQWIGLTQFYFIRRTAALIGTAALLFGPAVLLPRSRRYLYLSVISVLVSLILVAQYLYFSYYGSFLQASALKYAAQAEAVQGTILTLVSPLLILFTLGLIVVVIGFFFIGPDKQQYRLNRREQLAALGLILMLFFAGNGYVVAKEYQRWGNASRLWKITFDNADVVRKIGVVNHTVIDFVKQAFKRRGVTAEEKAQFETWLRQRQLGDEGQRLQGVAAGRNVIFVQLESVEGWVLNREIGGKEITPNLNRLAREGLHLTNYWHHVGPGTTADAEFSTLTSLHPPMTEVPFFEYPFHDYYALPEHLLANGYRESAVLHGDEKTFWNRTAIYPQLDIKQYVGIEGYQPTRKVIWGLDDHEFFAQSIPKLKQFKQPFFVNLMALTSHTPFDLPDDLKQLRLDPAEHEISDFQLNYIETVNYVDHALGQLVEQLQQAGLYDNSLLVIYGDHTAQIAAQHDAAFARFEGFGDSYSDLEYLKHLLGPMVILAPGTEARGVVDAPGTHADLYPTLTNLLGLSTPGSVIGRDLLNASSPTAVRRRLGTGAVGSVVTRQTVYFASDDGEFAKGRCLSWPDGARVDIERCRASYDEQVLLTKISDIALRGNLINAMR